MMGRMAGSASLDAAVQCAETADASPTNDTLLDLSEAAQAFRRTISRRL